MAKSDLYVGIAFRRGVSTYWYDQVVMRSTGGPFVHSELFLQDGNAARFYTSFENMRQPSAITLTPRKLPLPDKNWEAVRFPVSAHGYKVAYALILQLMALSIPYNSKDLWQCAVPIALPFERDLDCMNPASWTKSGVFCSQLCLLFLRRLAAQGVLAVENSLAHRIYAVNSRGCSPNALHELLVPPPSAKKKARNSA